MKKIMVLVLVLSLVMTLWACRSGETTATEPSTTVADNGQVVGLCLRQYDQNAQYYDEIQTALQKAG